ncbi:MAG: sigma-54-dependent Fis family transcriptional regulator [Pirellulales bacterium]|nr:sigma-54-dependent Fis family transcriptional regulator [Pirellulales bacterium]
MTTTLSRPVLEILLVDDDAELRADMASYFAHQGHRVDQCSSGEEALELIDRREVDVVVLDLIMPGMNGIGVLKELQQRGAECEVVVLTGEATVETAVEAMKLGAREFLTKPISLKELDRLVCKSHERGQLRKENLRLKAVLKHQRQPTTIVGESPPMKEMFRLIERVGPTDKPILIQGESGTGKELVARALHEASLVADKPLVVINCAALPETLLESELFGYEKGAFTGATGTKPGLFEVADGGTMFIDEIGELAPGLQAKLLRVLEDGTLRRVGSVKERRVRVRLIAATNRDLLQEVRDKRFREDLFYRINVLTIHLPPLRQRAGDLKLLIEHLTGTEWRLDPEVLPILERYSWPGNVRQLQNALDRAKILADDDRIRAENLPPEIVSLAYSRPAMPTADVDLDTLTRDHVMETYRRHASNKARTARALGIGRRTLYRLLEKYSISDSNSERQLS